MMVYVSFATGVYYVRLMAYAVHCTQYNSTCMIVIQLTINVFTPLTCARAYKTDSNPKSSFYKHQSSIILYSLHDDVVVIIISYYVSKHILHACSLI